MRELFHLARMSASTRYMAIWYVWMLGTLVASIQGPKTHLQIQPAHLGIFCFKGILNERVGYKLQQVSIGYV